MLLIFSGHVIGWSFAVNLNFSYIRRQFEMRVENTRTDGCKGPLVCVLGTGTCHPIGLLFQGRDLSECIFHEFCICILFGYRIQDMFRVLSGSW